MQSNEGFFVQEHYSQATGQRERRCDWLKAVGPAVTDVEQKGWSPGAGKQPVHHLFTHSNPSDSCVMFGVIRFVLPDNNLTMSLVSFTSHTPQAGETDPGGVDDLREDRLNCVIFYCVLSCPRAPLHPCLFFAARPVCEMDGWNLPANLEQVYSDSSLGTRSDTSRTVPSFLNASI